MQRRLDVPNLVNPLRYNTSADVNTRLHQSVITYKGMSVYADQCGVRDRGHGDDLTIDLFDPIKGCWIEAIHSSDEDLDVRAIPLGYANLGPDALAYVVRQPQRRTHAGVHTSNTAMFMSSRSDRVVNVSRVQLTAPNFHQMCRGIYPTLPEAIETLRTSNKRQQGVAIARKLAVIEDEVGLIKLHYFTTPVGVYNEKKERFILAERLAHYLPVLKSLGAECSVLD